MTTVLFSIDNDKLDATGVTTIISAVQINETTKIEVLKSHEDLSSITVKYCGHNTIKVVWKASKVRAKYTNIQLKIQ